MITKRWYFTDLPFDDHPSLQGSNHWNDITERGVLVGEQWFEPPWPERPRTVDGLDGDHECGELDDFEQGQPWPYTGPPIQYDDDHIPLCCPRVRPPQVRGGGSASAFFNVLPPPFASTCCDAPLMDSGTLYAATIHGGPIEGTQVFRYVATADAASLSINGFGNNFVATLQVTSGVDCAHQDTVLWAAFFGTYTIPLSTSVGRTVCINIIPNTLLPGGPYTLLVTLPGLPQVNGGGVPSATHSYIPPHTHVDSTSGGMEAGGAVGDVASGVDATAGGSRAGGSVGEEPGGIDATAGGSRAGGSAGDVPSATDATAGGSTAGGSTGDVESGIDATAGGSRAGGSTGDVESGIDATAGGSRAGGSVGDVPSGIDTTNGGSEMGGEVGDVFTPPAPVFHSVASGNLSGGFVPPAPATNGDLLVAFVFTVGGLTQTANTGWTQVGQVTTSSDGGLLGCYTKTRTGTDPKPITGTTGAYIVYAVTGWSAVDASATNADAGANTSLVAPSLAITANDFELFAYGCADSLAAATFPGGLTVTRWTVTTPHIAVGRRTSSTNPTGTQTATISAARQWATISVAVK